MIKKKTLQHNLSKHKGTISFEDTTTSKKIKLIIGSLKWFFLLIFLFNLISILALLLTDGQSYIQIIIGYSITGFFAFFTCYFGWILVHGFVEMINLKNNKITRGVVYYFRKNQRHEE